MQHLEVSGAVRPIYWALGVKRLRCRGGICCTNLQTYNYIHTYVHTHTHIHTNTHKLTHSHTYFGKIKIHCLIHLYIYILHMWNIHYIQFSVYTNHHCLKVHSRTNITLVYNLPVIKKKTSSFKHAA